MSETGSQFKTVEATVTALAEILAHPNPVQHAQRKLLTACLESFASAIREDVLREIREEGDPFCACIDIWEANGNRVEPGCVVPWQNGCPAHGGADL